MEMVQVNNNLEYMFQEFMSKTSEMNEVLAANNKTAISIAEDANNRTLLQGKVINTILHTLEEQDVRQSDIENKLLVHMENELISPMQRDNISDRAKYRVSQFLNYPSNEWHLYSKTYFKNLYGFLRRNYGLMNKIGNTKAKDYDNVMAGMNDWYPNEAELKERADLNREYRSNK